MARMKISLPKFVSVLEIFHKVVMILLVLNTLLFQQLEVVSIFNGKIAHEGQFPFAVSFGLVTENSSFNHICGGSVIKNYKNYSLIISAAHCFAKHKEQKIKAIVGKNVISRNSKHQCVVQKIITNEYNANGFQNDVSIVIIKCQFPNFNSIALYSQYDQNKYDCLIFGYGVLNYNQDPSQNFSYKLQYGSVNQISQNKCEQLVDRFVAPMPNNGQFCAHGEVDACPGDSGGAMICKSGKTQLEYKLFGVISYGTPCGQNSVGIYEDVTFNRLWIITLMENNDEFNKIT